MQEIHMTSSNFTIDKESYFSFDELFFSRTDERGVILSGNSVFQRVSEHDWSGLLNKPHNLIRHPDMPRGVFHLFWETVKSGSPIGAYVKNRSKNGLYYWVFALAIPIKDGYLSIRLKPSSPLLPVVESEYKKLRSAESTQKLQPKDSQALLLADLKSLGFKNYNAFMVNALMKELESRQQKLEKPPIALLTSLNKVLASCETMNKKAIEILQAYQVSAFVPLNLEIKTNKIGEEAAPLAVVASKYETMAKEIQKEILSFNKASESIQARVENAQFSICAALLQTEVFNFFKNEKSSGQIDVQLEMKALEELKQSSIRQAIEDLRHTSNEFSSFGIKCEELKKLSTGLEIVRLTGKIEASKINVESGEFKSLLDELTKFRLFLSKSLDEIENVSTQQKGFVWNMADDLRRVG